jgi:membrane-associated phospholipid phosphatase
MTTERRIPLKPLAAGGLFLAWLAAFLLGGPGNAPDPFLYAALYAGDNPAFRTLARFFTEVGGAIVLLPLTFLSAGWLVWKGRRHEAFLFLALTLGGRVLVELQKIALARPRPLLSEHLVTVESMSFPSGHAANGLVFWLAAALLLPSRHRPAWIAAAALLAFLIGLSRVMLGVHWPSDVIGGWAFGLLWILALSTLRAGPADRAGTPGAGGHSSS